jgi:hypothetical protein
MLDTCYTIGLTHNTIGESFFHFQPTHWKGPVPERVTLPRKAAYFTVVAADAMVERHHEIGKSNTAEYLWLLASRLYSCNPNPIDGGGDYGWASLRAFCLDALSTQGSSDLSLEAADQLLSLIGRLEPVTFMDADKSSSQKLLQDGNEGNNEDDGSMPTTDDMGKESDTSKELPRAAVSLEDRDFKEALTTANQFAKNLRVTYNNLTAGSQLIAQQTKWASEKSMSSIEVPLSTVSVLAPFLVSLKVVWPEMSYDLITVAQKHCIERAALLRRSIPTRSASFDIAILYDFDEKEFPIFISLDVMISPEPRLELECIKKRDPANKAAGGGLETFYNPFAQKATEDGPIARIAAEENCIVHLQFGNRLAVPVHIHRSQLEFDDNSKIKTTTISFVIPPKSEAFVVNYPFQVASNHQNEREVVDSFMLHLKGVNFTCLGQQIFLPFNPTKRRSSVIAQPSRLLFAGTSGEKTTDAPPINPKIECYPRQPNLRLLYSETNAPVPDVIPISLADGEILKLIPIHMYNSSGANAEARIVCLEILMAGTPIRKLYDSSTETIPSESLDNFFEGMIYGSDPVPFQLRALTDKLNIEDVNSANDVSNDKNVVVFEFAASSTLQRKLREDCLINIIFRYRGVGTSKTDVWRKRTITFHISPCTGPQIKSIEFRPDLMMKHMSFFDEIHEAQVGADIDIVSNQETTAAKLSSISTSMIHCCVGQYHAVSICGSYSVFILTIANEGQSDVLICRKDEYPSETSTYNHISMMHDLMIHPGANAQYPIVVRRIGRIDENGNPMDIVSAFARLTTLIWKSDNRRGYICIPPSTIYDIIYHQRPDLVSQICTPPFTIELKGSHSDETMAKSTPVGQPIVLNMQIAPASWLPNELLVQPNDIYVTMEFRCQRKGNVSSSSSSTSSMRWKHVPHEFVWVGKLERTVPMQALLQPSAQPHTVLPQFQNHSTKLIITVPGTYVVSALVRIHTKRSTTTVAIKEDMTDEIDQGNEVWWSPDGLVISVS